MGLLRIGRLARLAEVNVQTVRFYEREGILPQPGRRPSGYREYPPETIGIVRIIKHLQRLGFSLKEIKELLARRRLRSVTLGTASEKLASKIGELDVKIAELQGIRATLAQMLENHRQRADVPFAPLFDKHVEQLASEALAGESRDGRNHRRSAARAKKSVKAAKAS
jgi:MerR family transcriptional regulator, copper efflux regulator